MHFNTSPISLQTQNGLFLCNESQQLKVKTQLPVTLYMCPDKTPHESRFISHKEDEQLYFLHSPVKSLIQKAAKETDAVQVLLKHHHDGKQVRSVLVYTSNDELSDLQNLSSKIYGIILNLKFFPLTKKNDIDKVPFECGFQDFLDPHYANLPGLLSKILPCGLDFDQTRFCFLICQPYIFQHLSTYYIHNAEHTVGDQ